MSEENKSIESQMPQTMQVVDLGGVILAEILKLKEGGFTKEDLLQGLADLAKQEVFGKVVDAAKDIGLVPSELKAQFAGFEGSVGEKCRFAATKLRVLADLADRAAGVADQVLPAKGIEPAASKA